MSKTKEDVIKSRQYREENISKYGSVPLSIIDVNYSRNKMMWDPRGRKVDNMKKQLEKRNLMQLNNELGGAFEMTFRGVRGKENKDSHSILPYSLVEDWVGYYSESGDVVLNPTMGDMSSMTVTHHLNRHFIGYDVSEVNYGINEKLRDRLLGNHNQLILEKKDVNITIYKQSSEKLNQVDNSVDFVFFSPPYWDLEFYGNESEQLGIGKTYDDFLRGLSNVIKECNRVLKPGKFILVNINDFRKGGKFYSYHRDVIDLLESADFDMWDVRIVKWSNSIGQAFAKNIFSTKISSKMHEYCIIARKKFDGTKVIKTEFVNTSKYTDGSIDTVVKYYEGAIGRDKAIELLDTGWNKVEILELKK